jgi:hypothetical protein
MVRDLKVLALIAPAAYIDEPLLPLDRRAGILCATFLSVLLVPLVATDAHLPGK